MNENPVTFSASFTTVKTFLPSFVKTITLSQEEYSNFIGQAEHIEILEKKYTEALIRENKLQEEVQKLRSQVADLQRRHFGTSSEKLKPTTTSPEGTPDTQPSKKRGGQPGQNGHGRTKQPSSLPVLNEIIPVGVCACEQCGKVYKILNSYEESDVIEIHVKAHIRRIQREKAIATCNCKGNKKIITAPIPPKLIPKSPYGASIFERILLDKYNYGQPVN